MTSRRQYIEQVRRLIYNGQPSDDATITVGLVNQWIGQAIGIAAQKNYTDNLQLDGVAYMSDSFYTTYKNISVTKNENNLYQLTLPEIPVGLGTSEGLSSLEFKDSFYNKLSYPIIWISQNQKSFQRGMRPIPNKILGYSEGKYIYVITALPLSNYTANVTMVSGGSSTDLDSTLNVPDNYIPVMTDYLVKNLMLERNVPVDNTNDGEDFIKTT